MPEPIFYQKRQQILLNIFFVLVLIGLIFYFRGEILEIIKKRGGVLVYPSSIYPPPLIEKIKINFEIFQHPFLKELLPFEKLPEFKETPGRENPFSPLPTPKP